MGSNPIEALIFFRLLLSNCLNWKIYCDDHTSLSSHTAVQIWIISYIFHINPNVTLEGRGQRGEGTERGGDREGRGQRGEGTERGGDREGRGQRGEGTERGGDREVQPNVMMVCRLSLAL